MLTAITRAVSPAIVHCELSFIDRKPIDLARARQQHQAYEVLLAKLGARVVSLPPEPHLPDDHLHAPVVEWDYRFPRAAFANKERGMLRF